MIDGHPPRLGVGISKSIQQPLLSGLPQYFRFEAPEPGGLIRVETTH